MTMALSVLLVIAGIVLFVLLIAAGVLAYLAWSQPQQMGTAQGSARIVSLVLLALVGVLILGCLVVVAAVVIQIMLM